MSAAQSDQSDCRNLVEVRSPSRRSAGFTLIEILVVIIILGIIAAVAVPVYLNQKEKAYRIKTVGQMRNTVPVLLTARDNRQSMLKDVTGGTCSACACRVPNVLLKVSDPDFPATTCGVRWYRTSQRLADASGEPVESLRVLMTDGWGYPIVMSENEGDPLYNPTCNARDNLRSAGPNHTLSIPIEPDDITQHMPKGFYCYLPYIVGG